MDAQSDLSIQEDKTYRKCSKISNTKVSDKMTWANIADPDQTAPDQGLHCLPFH